MYQAPRKKKNWWEELWDNVGQVADKIIPGDQSSWHSGGNNKHSQPSQPTAPVQQPTQVRPLFQNQNNTFQQRNNSIFDNKAQDLVNRNLNPNTLENFKTLELRNDTPRASGVNGMRTLELRKDNPQASQTIAIKPKKTDPRLDQVEQQRKSVRDVDNYYTSDYEQLKKELAKGSNADNKRVEGLMQSLNNRKQELDDFHKSSYAKKEDQAFNIFNPLGTHGDERLRDFKNDRKEQAKIRADLQKKRDEQSQKNDLNTYIKQYGDVPLNSGSTVNSTIQKYNSADAYEQARIRKDLEEKASRVLDYGDEKTKIERDEASVLLMALGEKGKDKLDIGQKAGEFGGGIIKGIGDTFTNVGESARVLATDKTSLDDIEKDYREGKIKKSEYIKKINEANNRLSEFTGGSQDRGAWDRALRAAGVAADVSTMVVPVGTAFRGGKLATQAGKNIGKQSVSEFQQKALSKVMSDNAAKRLATNVRGTTASTVPGLMVKEGGLNAAIGGASAFRQGTDTTLQGVATEAGLGGVFGGVISGGAYGVTRGLEKGLNKIRGRNALDDQLDELTKQVTSPTPLQDDIKMSVDKPQSGNVTDSVNHMQAIRDGDVRYFDNGTDKVARERFDIPNLKKISKGGSDRDVYDLGDGNVLKVSKTARGLIQNQAEVDFYAQQVGLIPETRESGLNYVVAEKVDPPDANTRAMVRQMKKIELDKGRESPEMWEFLQENGLDDIMNYDNLWNDFTSIRNWGTRNGEPIHVDGGTLAGRDMNDAITKQLDNRRSGLKNSNLDDPEFREIYDRSRAAKQQFGDTDRATMYSKTDDNTLRIVDNTDNSAKELITQADMPELIALQRARFGDEKVRLGDIPEGDNVRGYYKYSDDMIALAEGKATRETLNHEHVHKAIGQFLSDQEIERLYSDVVKIRGGKSKLTKHYRENGYPDASWRTAAEEEIANEFNNFLKYKQTLKTSDNIADKLIDFAQARNLPYSIVRILYDLSDRINAVFGRNAAAGRMDDFYKRIVNEEFANPDIARRTSQYVEPMSVAENLKTNLAKKMVSVKNNKLSVDPNAAPETAPQTPIEAPRNKRALDADATMERLRQRAANKPKQPTIAETYGLKPETVQRLIRDYGEDRTRLIIQRSSDATNIRSMDAFVVSEAQKQYGKVAPTRRVKINQTVPEQRVISDEELAAMEAAEFGTPNTVKINQATDAEERLIANKLADEKQRSQPNYLSDQQERQLAEQFADTPEGRVDTATGEIVDEVPPVRDQTEVLTPDDVEMLRADVQNALDEAGFDDVSLADVIHIGSTKSGKAHAGSDIDMLVTYNGTAREDDVFNALAEYVETNNLTMNGRKLDFNPVRADDVDQIAALTNTPPVREVPATPEQLDAMPTQTSGSAPLEYPTTPQRIRERLETDAELGNIMSNFYESKQGNQKIRYAEMKAAAETAAARAYNAFQEIGSDLRKVAQITQEHVDKGIKNVDEMTGLTPAEKDLWKAIQDEQNYMRNRASLGGKEIGGDQGDSYWHRVSRDNKPTPDTLFEGFRDTKPGSEMKRRTDEYALTADEISYSPEVISKYIIEHGDTKLLQEERIYRALEKSNPDLPEETIRDAARKVIEVQDKVNNLSTKVKLGVKKVTISDGKVINTADEMSKVGRALGKDQKLIDDTPKGLTNGDRINSVNVNYKGEVHTVADFLGLNQYRDSLTYAGTQINRAGSDMNALADMVSERLTKEYRLPKDDVEYLTESVRRMKAGLPDEVVLSRVNSVYRNAAKQQLMEQLQNVNITNKTLQRDVSRLANQILREGSIQTKLSAKIVQGTLRTTNALFRKLNLSSAINELSDLTSFITIYDKGTKLATPDFKLVKEMGLGELDPAIEPFLKQVEAGGDPKTILKKMAKVGKSINDGTRFYKALETYKAAVLLKTARDFYSLPKNGGLTGDALTAKVIEDYRQLALPVDAFTKTFLDDYPLFTQYMTWGARNLEKEGRLLTGQIDAGVMKDKSTAQRVARDLYANIPAKTAFWLASNGLKGTAIMTAFGLTDFTGLTQQDYSGIAEEDKSWFDKTTQFTNISTIASLINSVIQDYEKEMLKEKYKDADYNPYENANFGDSVITTFTPQFLKNASGAKELQDKGYSENRAGRVQYEAPEDAWNIFKSFVFGKSQTENARQYSGRKNIVDRMSEGTDPFTAMRDMAAEQIGLKDADYNRPITDDYSKAYKEAEEGARTALLEGGKQYNDYLDNLKKEKPDLYNNYITAMDGNHVSPEYWRNISQSKGGGTNLDTFKMIRDRKKQLKNDLGVDYDPLYDLPDDQAAAVLRLKNAPTGDDLSVRMTLNKEQWYKDLKERQSAFYEANPMKDTDSQYTSTERVKEWDKLDDELNSFFYNSERVKEEGEPAWAKDFPLVYQQKAINDQYGFGSEQSSNFFKNNADAYYAQKEAYDKAQLGIINQMRKIEGYPEMSWEGYQQATKFANTDEDSEGKKSGWKNYGRSGGGKRSGGGGSSISPNANVTFNSAGTLKINKPTVKSQTVKIKRKGDVKKITFKRNKR